MPLAAPTVASLGADALGGISAVGSLVGGLFGAEGARNAAKAEAAAYRENALMAGISAANDWESLLRQNEETQQQTNTVIGEQKARYGAAGVNPQAGTPQAVAGSTQQQSNFLQGTRYATGIAEGQAASNQATADIAAANAAIAAGKEGAISALFGGLTSSAAKLASIL